MSEDAGEKTFAPTAKRRRDAARKGDVLRSRDLGAAASLLAGAAGLKFIGPWAIDCMANAMRQSMTWDRAAIDDFSPGTLLLSIFGMVLPPVLVLCLMALLASLVSQIALGEGRWVPANLFPKGSRINPLSGLSRMFGMSGWIEAGKGLLKVSLLGAMAWFWARRQWADLLGLGHSDLHGALARSWQAITSLLFVLATGLVVIALVDFPVQWLRRMMRLKMTQQEMRDENKEAEGSPERRASIRQRQRQIAMGSVASAMREAQFVITNPTHFAVAMTYDPAKASAPIVLAKGRGEKAQAMKELAREYEVPLLEYPALARSVYYTTRERQVIREELYAAVASVLAFVFSLRRGEHPSAPAIDVPVHIRFDAEGRLDPRAAA
jgi:flagellar biosynthetic protein FlhB